MAISARLARTMIVRCCADRPGSRQSLRKLRTGGNTTSHHWAVLVCHLQRQQQHQLFEQVVVEGAQKLCDDHAPKLGSRYSGESDGQRPSRERSVPAAGGSSTPAAHVLVLGSILHLGVLWRGAGRPQDRLRQLGVLRRMDVFSWSTHRLPAERPTTTRPPSRASRAVTGTPTRAWSRQEMVYVESARLIDHDDVGDRTDDQQIAGQRGDSARMGPATGAWRRQQTASRPARSIRDSTALRSVQTEPQVDHVHAAGPRVLIIASRFRWPASRN